MARPFQKISDLTDKSKWIRIAVRITSLWVVVDSARSGHLEMIVMDKHGDEIQISVRGAEYSEWKDKLLEKETFIMENFAVVTNKDKFKCCNHTFKMLFIPGTTVRPKDLEDIPPFEYKFTKFEDILNSKLMSNIFIDVIGVVENINTDNVKRVALALKDLSETYIQCTIWDDYARKFLTYWNNRNQGNKCVVILRRVRIKEAQGSFGIQLSNCYGNVTEVITDISNPSIVEFSEKLKDLPLISIETSCGLSQSSQLSSFTQYSDKSKFMFKAMPLTIGQISRLTNGDVIDCVTVAETVDLVTQKGGWFYDGCCYCTKKRPASDVDDPFICVDNKCKKENSHSCPRYKLSIVLKGESNDTVKATFFDDHCSPVIGKSAEDLRKQMLELGEDDPKSYPLALDKMVGIQFALRLRVQPRFSSVSVQKANTNPDYIKEIQAQLNENEETSKTEDSSIKKNQLMIANVQENSDHSSNEEFVDTIGDELITFPTQSLSASADHDPQMIKEITPTKRDISPLEENADGQLSRNKVTKTKNKKDKMAINVKLEV